MRYWQGFSRAFASFTVVPERDDDKNIGSPLRSIFACCIVGYQPNRKIKGSITHPSMVNLESRILESCLKLSGELWRWINVGQFTPACDNVCGAAVRALPLLSQSVFFVFLQCLRAGPRPDSPSQVCDDGKREQCQFHLEGEARVENKRGKVTCPISFTNK